VLTILFSKLRKYFQKDYIWSFTTYFTQGFPFTITRTVVPVFLRDLKVSLETIGLTSLYGLPFILKLFWSPFVDKTETKRKWIILSQSLIFLLLLFVPLFISLKFSTTLILALFFIVAFISATDDIAIDGYYIATLDSDGQAKFVGYRVMAYRIAMITATAGIVTVGARWGWSIAFFMAALLMGFFAIFHILFLKEAEKSESSFKDLFSKILNIKRFFIVFIFLLLVFFIRKFLVSTYFNTLKETYIFLNKISFSHIVSFLLFLSLVVLFLLRKKIKAYLYKNKDNSYGKAFLSFIDRDKIGIVLAFIIMLRVGEWMLSTMQAPFMVDLGLKMHYGWITGFVGLPSSILGAMIGGFFIYKYGLKKVIWPFILLQNLTNVIYMFLSIYLSNYLNINTGTTEVVSIGTNNLILVSSVMSFDQLSGGLGTSVLMTYIMRICVKEFKATHYAIGTGLMSLGGMFSGVLSGFVAEYFGYPSVFLLSFIISIPAMILIFFLPKYD
jgi:MFS transporter, PAT family, beta-lactamase induction signal transducer AmpG